MLSGVLLVGVEFDGKMWAAYMRLNILKFFK